MNVLKKQNLRLLLRVTFLKHVIRLKDCLTLIFYQNLF
jgi:hypothetical protein